jgi:hypothetical protein
MVVPQHASLSWGLVLGSATATVLLLPGTAMSVLWTAAVQSCSPGSTLHCMSCCWLQVSAACKCMQDPARSMVAMQQP